MRKAMVPFYLSNGILIPKGTHLATPVYMLTHDPTVLENPDVFDGFRYERMRREKGAEHKHQFEATRYVPLRIFPIRKPEQITTPT